MKIPFFKSKTADSKKASTTHKKVADSLQNSLLRLGASSKAGQGSYLNDLAFTRNWVQLNALYRSNWLTKRIIDLPCNDMTREWVELKTLKSANELPKIMQYDRKVQAKNKFNMALKWASLYGGSLVYMDFGKASDPEKPITPKLVQQNGLKALHVLERWRLTPSGRLVEDSTDPEFGEPTHYIFENTIIDRSRVIRLIPNELPWIEKYRENHWGSSVLEPVFNTIRKYDSISEAIIELGFLANLRHVKVDGLRDSIADGDSEQIFEAFGMLSLMANINNISLIDKDDELVLQQYGFSGIADVITTFMTEVCGAAEIPITKLFGETIKGLNNTGDGDIRQYYDNIKTKQEALLRQALMKYYSCAVPSAIGIMPDDFDFDFNNLWQISDKETAEIVYQQAQADQIYFDKGVMTEQALMKELKARGFYKNVPDPALAVEPAEPESANDPEKKNKEAESVATN